MGMSPRDAFPGGDIPADLCVCGDIRVKTLHQRVMLCSGGYLWRYGNMLKSERAVVEAGPNYIFHLMAVARNGLRQRLCGQVPRFGEPLLTFSSWRNSAGTQPETEQR